MCLRVHALTSLTYLTSVCPRKTRLKLSTLLEREGKCLELSPLWPWTEFRCLNTTPKFPTSDVSLPRIRMCTLLHRWTFGEMNASFIKTTQALLFGTWHRSLIFLSFLWRNLRDPIGRQVSPWRNWLVDCSPTSLSKLCLAFKVSQSRTFYEWGAPVLGQFLSDFVRIKSYYKSVNNAQKLGQSNPDIQHFIQIGEKTLLLVVVAQNFNPNDIQKE